MITIFNKDSNTEIGQISEESLKFLIDNLEEMNADDKDYYINIPTIELFEELGAEPEFVSLLKKAIGDGEEMEIRWERS